MPDEVPIPNGPLSAAEESAAAKLTSDDNAFIDAAILSCALPRWRKVAMMVGRCMEKLESRYPGFSDSFYARRIQTLASQGRLESQGNLDCMRFSEVRLPDES